MSKKEVITVPNPPNLPLSPAIRAGDYIFVSGRSGHKDDEGREVKGIEAQTRQCMERVKQALEMAGSSVDDIIKVTIFLASTEDFAQMNEVYRSYFPNKDYPARSTVVVGLLNPAMHIEIECIAYKP
jgi:2-iminobutanoate/2-iminopropanoate deaminase